MDGRILAMTERLESALSRIDVNQDRDTLVWAHGFLSSVLKGIERQIPDLTSSATLLQTLKEKIDFKENLDSGAPDSLDDIEREMEGGPGVPATGKTGPKGRTGGTALPLPDGDRAM